MSPILVTVALVALERGAELIYAERNTRALRRRGAIETGAGHYPVIVGLHAAWLAALLILVPGDRMPVWPLLGLFITLQGLRFWVLASLGPYWTTRIITLPGVPLVRRGPYRFLRHPNYLVVATEIVVLPLAFRAYGIALVFGLLNLAVLAWRITVEERMLAPRRVKVTIP